MCITVCGSSVGISSASNASGPEIDPRVRHILSCKMYFPLPLIQEQQVVGFWRKNGH